MDLLIFITNINKMLIYNSIIPMVQYLSNIKHLISLNKLYLLLILGIYY